MIERKMLNSISKPPEKCPDCGADVRVKSESIKGEYHHLVLHNLNGSLHRCGSGGREYEKHPIGQAVIGGIVKDFHLKGRRLTIIMEDGNILSVSAAGKPLSLQLEGPGGIIQE